MLDFELFAPYMLALFVELFFWVFIVSGVLISGGFAIEFATKRLRRDPGKTSIPE